MAKKINRVNELTDLNLLDSLGFYDAGNKGVLIDAVIYNLVFYVEARCPRNCIVSGLPPLQHAFRNRFLSTLEMINCLIGLGVDPNLTWERCQDSAWILALLQDYRTGHISHKDHLEARENYKQVLKTMARGRLWHLNFSGMELRSWNNDILKEILVEEKREIRLIPLSRLWFKARELESMILHASRRYCRELPSGVATGVLPAT